MMTAGSLATIRRLISMQESNFISISIICLKKKSVWYYLFDIK